MAKQLNLFEIDREIRARYNTFFWAMDASRKINESVKNAECYIINSEMTPALRENLATLKREKEDWVRKALGAANECEAFNNVVLEKVSGVRDDEAHSICGRVREYNEIIANFKREIGLEEMEPNA